MGGGRGRGRGGPWWCCRPPVGCFCPTELLFAAVLMINIGVRRQCNKSLNDDASVHLCFSVAPTSVRFPPTPPPPGPQQHQTCGRGAERPEGPFGHRCKFPSVPDAYRLHLASVSWNMQTVPVAHARRQQSRTHARTGASHRHAEAHTQAQTNTYTQTHKHTQVAPVDAQHDTEHTVGLVWRLIAEAAL